MRLARVKRANIAFFGQKILYLSNEKGTFIRFRGIGLSGRMQRRHRRPLKQQQIHRAQRDPRGHVTRHENPGNGRRRRMVAGGRRNKRLLCRRRRRHPLCLPQHGACGVSRVRPGRPRCGRRGRRVLGGVPLLRGQRLRRDVAYGHRPFAPDSQRRQFLRRCLPRRRTVRQQGAGIPQHLRRHHVLPLEERCQERDFQGERRRSSCRTR